MRAMVICTLAVGLAACATAQTAEGNADACLFSSISDSLADKEAVFPVRGLRLDFDNKAGFTAYRSFLIGSCPGGSAFSCFTAEYVTFGVPKSPLELGQSWTIGPDHYKYEQDVTLSVFGRSESFGVISRSVGTAVESKFLVNSERGLAAIMFFNDKGRSTYQLYLQGNSCHPFAIDLSKSPAPERNAK